MKKQVSSKKKIVSKSVKKVKSLALAGALLLGFGLQQAHAAALTDLPDISLLTPYATFGQFYNDSAVTVNGNAGISNNGSLNLMAPSTINGNLDLGLGATVTGPGTVTGTTTTGLDLTAAQLQVFTASAALNALTPTDSYTFTNVNTGMTFGSVNGIADVTVVDITGTLTLGSGQNITFVGDPGDYFVLNVNDMALTGDATIGSLGQASHTLVNLYGSGNLGTVAHVGNMIDGTTLVPNADTATFHSVSGAIYSGYGTITLMSDATVNYVPFTPPSEVPEPGMMLLLGSGLVGLAAAGRKFRG